MQQTDDVALQHDVDEIKAHVDVACRPRHIHLSVGGRQNSTHTSMIVSFSFRPECVGYFGDAAVGAVLLGERSAQDMSLWVVGDINDVQSYNASLTDGELPYAEKGQVRYFSDAYYHIEIEGLKPATRYYYECILVRDDRHHLPRQSSRQDQVWQSNNYQVVSNSGQNVFLTPPSPGQWYPPPLDRTIKFAALGDLAGRSHSKETVKNLEQRYLGSDEDLTPEERFHRSHSHNIDCILLAGDLSYADGMHMAWDAWMDMLSNYSFFSSIPMHIALGNHDIDHRDTLEVGMAYERRFRMPQVRPAVREPAPNNLFKEGKGSKKYFHVRDFIPYEWGNAYYTFTFGPSKHIVLSSYSQFHPGSIQYQWLVSELEAVDRSVTPWVIVMLHCPVYTTFYNHRKEKFITEARLHLEPVFVKYTVNFVISGHLHSYMRTAPTINSQPDARGPIYIIQGNGGREVNEPFLNVRRAEEWVEHRDKSTYGYGILELFNETTARWEWVKTGFSSGSSGDFQKDFGLTDEVWVTNQLLSSRETSLSS